MYPLKFENIYFDKIWGGRDLELFRDNLPTGSIGESWDISCHPHGMGVVANGDFKGITLEKLIEKEGERLIGRKISKERFPLLVKIINAKEKLSVQVHPNDEYGYRVEGEPGKTEVWYVIEALEGANLVVGTKDCTEKDFKNAIESGDFDPYMNRIEVKKGEVYFVQSGLVHAIGEGVIIAEIQQNSDTTYRVFDYNRGRELHVERALETINFSLKGERSIGLKVEREGYCKTYYSLCEHFSLEKYEVKDSFTEKSDEERFYIFTVVEGTGSIKYDKGEEVIKKGESILIPASLGEYTIKGNISLLKSYVPDIQKVEQEILNTIKA